MFPFYQSRTIFVVVVGSLVTISLVAAAGFYFLENKKAEEAIKEQQVANEEMQKYIRNGSVLPGGQQPNFGSTGDGTSSDGSGSALGTDGLPYTLPEATDWTEVGSGTDTLTDDLLTDPDSDTDTDSETNSNRLTVKGDKLYDPSGHQVTLRGFNWGWWGTAQEQDGAANKDQGATAVRMPIRWYFEGTKNDIRETGGTCNISADGLKAIDANIAWATKEHLWVVLFMGSDLGAGNSDDNYWTNPALKAEFKATWLCLAQRYKNVPYIAAYEILSEPHPKKSYTNNDPEGAVKAFYEEMIQAIRTVDEDTPLMIGPNDHYEILQLPGLYTNVDKKIIYTFNFYYPAEYVKETKDGSGHTYRYPGSLTLKDGQVVTNDKAYLEDMLKNGTDFRDDHDVPIFINQVGIASDVPDAKAYITDTLDLFESYGIGFAYWTYRVRGTINDMGIYYQDPKTNVWSVKSDWLTLISGYFD